jgi:hypothetical protein
LSTAVENRRFFHGVPLPVGEDVVRVNRAEDMQIEEALLDGSLVYVRAPRKSGKSSIAKLMAVRLAQGVSPRIVVKFDLTNVGQYDGVDQFNGLLQSRQVSAFDDLVQQTGIATARAEVIRHETGDNPDWFWRAVELVAREAPVPIIVFIDEIEEILDTHRAVGEAWLVGLRQAHQTAEGKFTACILGQLPLYLLVRSSERTPFNTAREIVLPDFSLTQVAEMAETLNASLDGINWAPVIARVIFNQTGGQPNLTQYLLGKMKSEFGTDTERLANSYSEFIARFVEEDSECQPSSSNTYMGVDLAFESPGTWPAADALANYAKMLENGATGKDRAPLILFDPWSDGQRMLEAIGLAKVVGSTSPDSRDGAYRFLTIRSGIVRRIFDRDWLGRRLSGIAPQSSTGSTSAVLAEMETIAREELCRTEWALEHEATITPNSGREVVEGALFEFELVRQRPSERLTLQMFRGIGQFGRRLWLRQVRTLRQLGAQAGALPQIHRGSLLNNGSIAYIITQRPQFTLAEPLFQDYIRNRRRWALTQFQSLAKGLERLASQGVTHRNIWPGSIRVDLDQDEEVSPEFKLVGFEFSVMLRSMAAGAARDPGQIVDERRRALQQTCLQQPPLSRPYAPPEFLEGLFGSPADPVPALVTSDVFSLGMVVAGWFVGPPDADSFEAVLKSGDAGSTEYSEQAHQSFVAAYRTVILKAVNAQHLPAVLGDLLREMLEFDPEARPTPTDVLDALDKNIVSLRNWAMGERKPMLACYSYQHTADQLSAFGLVTSETGTEDSRRDVEAFLERELRNAQLFYAPLGVAPYVETPLDGHHQAQWALLGQNWIFYCQRYNRRQRGFGASVQLPHVLRIAYPRPLHRFWRVLPEEAITLSEHGPLRIVEQRSTELNEENDAKYRVLDPILNDARRRILPPSFEIAQSAFNWLVEAQIQDLELQSFPVMALGPVRNRQCDYVLDVQAYRERCTANVMRSAVFQASNIRVPKDYFEQIFLDALARDDRALSLRPERRDGERRSTARLEDVTTAGITISGNLLPPRALVELRSLSMGRRPIRQQSEAIEILTSSRILFDQLLQPHVIVDDEGTDQAAIAAAVEGLAGRSPEIVRKIVTTSPLMALQGPPGTGKTTVIAAVVNSLFRHDRTSRILITSQSHAAVDNIALRIRDLKLEDDGAICVRVAADSHFDEERIDHRLRAWRPEETANRVATRLRANCEQNVLGIQDPILRQAYGQLAVAATDGILELVERVREGATLVFATTAGSSRVQQDGYLTHGKFDLAVIDEASKAWPTEIIQPMLLGDRQLLVGDHFQLPAFGSTDISRLLAQCIKSDRAEFRVLANHQAAVRAWLKLFETFFDKGNKKFVASADQKTLPGWRDKKQVAEQLDLQFRMRSDIADVVSHTFYKDALKSDASVDARIRPVWVDRMARDLGMTGGILWIDTSHDELFRSPKPYYNEDQAKLVARLVSHASDVARQSDESGDGRPDIVALSPYRKQNDFIRRELMGGRGSDLTEFVSTVDSFQGQEAEVVVLSLTRGQIGAEDGTESAARRLGFMAEPERINVMFSRARELLIIIGDFSFFADAERVEKRNNPNAPRDLSFWTRLCRRIAETGQVIGVNELPTEFEID